MPSRLSKHLVADQTISLRSPRYGTIEAQFSGYVQVCGRAREGDAWFSQKEVQSPEDRSGQDIAVRATSTPLEHIGDAAEDILSGHHADEQRRLHKTPGLTNTTDFTNVGPQCYAALVYQRPQSGSGMCACFALLSACHRLGLLRLAEQYTFIGLSIAIVKPSDFANADPRNAI